MGFLRSTGRFLFYPVIRPAEQAKESFGLIKNDLEKLRVSREARLARIEVERAEHLERIKQDDWTGYKPTEAELKNPKLIKDHFLRFEILYESNGWDENQLLEQLTAVRLAKRVGSVMAVFLMAAGVVSMVFVPVWLLLVTGPLLLTGSAIGFATAMKHGLFQAQLEARKLLPFSEFVARPDLVSYLFSR